MSVSPARDSSPESIRKRSSIKPNVLQTMHDRAQSNFTYICFTIPPVMASITYRGAPVNLSDAVITLPKISYANITCSWGSLLARIKSDCASNIIAAVFKNKLGIGGDASTQTSKKVKDALDTGVTKARENLLLGRDRGKGGKQKGPSIKTRFMGFLSGGKRKAGSSGDIASTDTAMPSRRETEVSDAADPPGHFTEVGQSQGSPSSREGPIQFIKARGTIDELEKDVSRIARSTSATMEDLLAGPTHRALATPRFASDRSPSPVASKSRLLRRFSVGSGYSDAVLPAGAVFDMYGGDTCVDADIEIDGVIHASSDDDAEVFDPFNDSGGGKKNAMPEDWNEGSDGESNLNPIRPFERFLSAQESFDTGFTEPWQPNQSSTADEVEENAPWQP